MPINPVPISDGKQSEKKEKIIEEFHISEPKYTFEDIILSQEILDEVKQIIALNEYNQLIFEAWGLNSVIKSNKNTTVNLYGVSGTGKTMTAHAIAQSLNKKLLIVNYSEIESKYVGETSKNLVKLFEFAKRENVIILFDEADALLSKRVTAMNSATDVSVNQTRNVLLKLLDEYEGIVIFTTNFIQNYDSAFFRRIMCHIKFNEPDKEMRKRLWTHYIVDQMPLGEEKDIVVEKLSELENVTGSDISTAVLKTAVSVAMKGEKSANYDDFYNQITKVIQAKKMINEGEFTITTKKVSEEYVKSKLGGSHIRNEDF